ncbi:UNVERIFIED_CONTAM: hypothetical protein Sangu_3162000 [Sesamum angustifolium]|uniref:Uncharacterized protein n=1 Tax=Sesamum angustifolium TaxID=2727405 RepID=A0AAW2JV59_9LAMI
MRIFGGASKFSGCCGSCLANSGSTTPVNGAGAFTGGADPMDRWSDTVAGGASTSGVRNSRFNHGGSGFEVGVCNPSIGGMTAIGIGDETSSGITQGTIESVGDETAEGSAIGRTLIVNDGFSKTLEHVFDDGAGVGINGAAPRRDSTCSRVGSHGHRRAGRSGAGNGVSCRVWTDRYLP